MIIVNRKIKNLIHSLSFFFGVFSTFSALAHNTLTSTLPADNAALHVAPTEIQLVFTDATYLVSLAVLNASGIDVLQEFEPASDTARSFTVVLPAGLERGLYQVSWAVIGNDTHRVEGEFSFNVDAVTEESEK